MRCGPTSISADVDKITIFYDKKNDVTRASFD